MTSPQPRSARADGEATTEPLDQPRPSRSRRSRVVRSLAIVAAVVASLVVAAIVVNAVTPRPYALLFRSLINTVDDSITLGPYADDAAAAQVKQSPVVTVPVIGAPDAGLTFYQPGETASTPRPMVLFIHGGGWMVGKAAQVGSYAKLLASRGYVVANLDYSLAPEHRYPTPIQQISAAITYLQGHAREYGADPTKLFIGGNSAGAQLAAQLGAMITNPAFRDTVGVDITLPAADLKGIILYSGPYDFDTVARDDFPGFRTYAWAYTGMKDYTNYARLDELSPVRHATTAYPPTYLTAGDSDPLEPQSYELDAVLRAQGVNVVSRYWTGTGQNLPHDYVFDLSTGAARTAFDDTVTFIRDQSHG